MPHNPPRAVHSFSAPTPSAPAHYENFPVASWLCPPRLRPPIAAIYGFARTADDIADEGDAEPAARLDALRAFRADAGRRGPRPAAPRLAGRAVFGPLARAIARLRAARGPAGRPARRLCAGRREDPRRHRLRRPAPNCWTIAAARPTRSAACCCTSTASTTPIVARAERRDLQRAAAHQLLAGPERRPATGPLLPARRRPARRTASRPRLRGFRPLGARAPPPAALALVADEVRWARASDAAGRAAGASPARAAPAGNCAWSCKAACASSTRSRRWLRHLLAARPTLGKADGTSSRLASLADAETIAAHDQTPLDDARAIRPGQGRRFGQQLLLRVSVPAEAAPRRHHGLLCLLPRDRRRGRRSQRPRRRGHQAGLVADRSGASLRRPAAPSGHAGADAARGRLRHRRTPAARR